MYSKRSVKWIKHIDFILLDAVCLLISVVVSFCIRNGSLSVLTTEEGQTLLVIVLVVNLFSSVSFRPFKNVLKRGLMAEFISTVRSALYSFGGLALLLYGTKLGARYSRITVFLSALIYLILSSCARTVYKQYLQKDVIPNRGRSLLLVTNPEYSSTLLEHLNKKSFNSFRLAGVVMLDTPEGFEGDSFHELQLLLDERGVPLKYENRNDLISNIQRNWVDEVMVILESTKDTWHIVDEIMSMGITAHMTLDSLESRLPQGTPMLETVGGYDVVSIAWNTIDPIGAAAKRLLDILGGIVGCVLTLLISIFIGPSIYIASPGPIFFKQKRVGRNGKYFYMYKFRSMVMNADELKVKYMTQNRVSDGMMFKLDWDPRIIGNKELPDGTRKTGIGDFIRRTSLDEFPQFFNVLMGDMSLVGTRPPTLDEWERYEARHRIRMAAKPGITGLWQVSGRSEITDFEEVVALDKQYLANWSFLEDIKIILKTVLVVLQHKGSM